MVTAPVLVPMESGEETDQAWIRTQIRRELYERFGLWLDATEEAVKEEPPSLDALTSAVFTSRHELTGMITEALVQQRHLQALDQKTLPCPQCGCLLRVRALVPRSVETLVGEVTLERPYFYCRTCKRGFYPLDEALELSERRKQWDI